MNLLLNPITVTTCSMSGCRNVQGRPLGNISSQRGRGHVPLRLICNRFFFPFSTFCFSEIYLTTCWRIYPVFQFAKSFRKCTSMESLSHLAKNKNPNSCIQDSLICLGHWRDISCVFSSYTRNMIVWDSYEVGKYR